MRARVKNGRWVLDDPTDLPEGTEVEIVTRPAPPAAAGGVYVDPKVRQYAGALLVAACSPKVSASTRGFMPNDEQELIESAKAGAFRRGSPFVTPEDIRNAAPAVLRRFVKADEHVTAILDQTPVP